MQFEQLAGPVIQPSSCNPLHSLTLPYTHSLHPLATPYIPEHSPPPTSQVIQLFSVRNPPSLHGKDSRPCVVMWLADSSGMHVGRKVSYTCCDYSAR